MVTIYFSNESGFDISEYESVIEDVIEESIENIPVFNIAPEVSVTFTDSGTLGGKWKDPKKIVIEIPGFEMDYKTLYTYVGNLWMTQLK